MTDRITKPQIAKIWASAHAIGMDRDMLYLLVPRGSISAMSRREAAELIEQLEQLAGQRVGPRNPDAFLEEKPRRRRVRTNAATQHQRNFIYFLFGKLGWLEHPERVRGFLQRCAHVETVEHIPSRKRASAIIEALKAIYRRMQAGTKSVQRN